MQVDFLEGSTPLTKSYAKSGGAITKTPYPFIWEFTSHRESYKTIVQLEHLLKTHAALGHCVLKGLTSRPLVKESRAGSTDTNGTSDLLVLDLDGLPETSNDRNADISLFLASLGVADVDYIVQWSASYGIENMKLRAHVFMLLDKQYAAPLLKQWLIQTNHAVPALRAAMSLTKTGNAISWPLDTSACQNDKLIYIAPPNLKGIKDPLANKPRIELHKRTKRTLALSAQIAATTQNRALTDARIKELRVAAGLPERKKIVYKMHGNTEVMLKPDECIVTDMKTERGFTYFNLNGGDSWAYFHPENNPDYIQNFKGEPAYLTKELLPDYWQQLTGTGSATRTSSAGLTYLAFLDRATGVYWRGTYEAATDSLDINSAKNETQLRHFAKQYGVPMGDFVPEWDLSFDPNDVVRVDVQNRMVNKFQPTEYMLNVGLKMPKAVPKTIMRVMSNALGDDPDIIEHFVNWLAAIVQTRDRTRTAWVLHGTQGCLAGETQIEFNRGKRNGSRPLSIKKAYEKWNGTFKQGTGLGKGWDLSIPTRAKSVRDGMTIGYHEVFKIVESGEKQLYKLTGSHGASIRATELHPFMRPDGSFTPLNELKPGDEIVIEGAPVKHYGRGGRKAGRTTIYSIPFHPHAWQHINDKNYKRSHRARLVVEAEMNAMTLDEFVTILRTDEQFAANLAYLAPTDIVHHLDEDVTNDSYTNLTVINKANHDAHHAKEVGLGYISTRIITVKSVKKDKVEMTYDMVMKAPYHNYIANGFAVHNTGKGILTNNILKPLFGVHTATRRMEELNEKYNHFMEGSFLVFVDEVETKALQNERGVMAKLKNFITEPTVAIRQMYANAVEVRNRTNWIFMSNKTDPIIIDKEDRRHNVGKYQPNKLVISDAEVDSIVNELQTFYNYLANYPVDLAKASTVIHSEDRNTMISISESSIDTVGSAIIEGDFNFFVEQLPTDLSHLRNSLTANRVQDYVDVLKIIMARTSPAGACNITREELRTVFDFTIGNVPNSPNKFTALLKHHRIHLEVVWVGGKSVRGIKAVWKDVNSFPQYQSMHFTPNPSGTAQKGPSQGVSKSPKPVAPVAKARKAVPTV